MVFALAITFYIYTLSPSLAWGDGVRLQSEVISGESVILAELSGDVFTPDAYPFSKVGVTAWDHPLYIVIGHLLVKAFPSVDSLWLVNLISAIFGAASVALIFILCYRSTHSLIVSFYTSFALAVSHTFWWHSSTPEVYTLFIFLLLLSYFFFDKFEHSKKIAHAVLAAFFLGLAASNHILAFLAFPALGLYLLLSRKITSIKNIKFKKLSFPLLSFTLGFSLYIIQFVRITQSLPLNDIAGPIIGSTFLSSLNLSPLLLAESLLKYLMFLALQFGPLGLILGAVGMRSSRKALSFYIIYMLFGVFYRVSDQFAFFMTSHVFFALLIGIGLNQLINKLDGRARFALTFILPLAIMLMPPFYRVLPNLAETFNMDDTYFGIPEVGTGVRNGFAYYIDPNKRGDNGAYDFGVQTLSNLPPNAVVITEWFTDTDEYFVLRHLTQVEGFRPDVTIHGWLTVAPASFDPQLVLDVIEDSFPEQPVYLASLSERFYSASELIDMYCIVPENNLYRVYPRGGDDLQCFGAEEVTD